MDEKIWENGKGYLTPNGHYNKPMKFDSMLELWYIANGIVKVIIKSTKAFPNHKWISIHSEMLFISWNLISVWQMTQIPKWPSRQISNVSWNDSIKRAQTSNVLEARNSSSFLLWTKSRKWNNFSKSGKISSWFTTQSSRIIMTQISWLLIQSSVNHTIVCT